MAAKRTRSQARRNSGNEGMPGWAWLVVGVVLTLLVVLAAPKVLKSDGEDGFYRPRANPDARPEPPASDAADDAAAAPARPAPAPASEPDYDFYTLLPGQEVPMTDAELAASTRAEQTRQAQAEAQARRSADATAPATAPTPAPAATAPAASPAAPGASAPATTAASTTATATAEPADSRTRYLLQAGSFSASGDAEALKARLALLGLSARVESAQVQGRTVYRVRMGPYGTASELSDAKQRLESSGLNPMPIKVQ